MDETLLDSSPAISVITEIELLCWKTDLEKDLIVLRDFIHDAQVLELEKNIKLKTAEIRKAHKIKLPDAIIAATALAHDFTLLTRNVKDFKHIEGLSLINPYEK
ncbi:MAG: type II toxin-antitoxin system VapC family toxin [Phaeodactylibacter sp.]|uniref:type II toxin-antitoxin system VapC family toxin n=1 Tax=Phaeodactylibacter sp. TaxID=1940289 RepID=UPI0032EE648A